MDINLSLFYLINHNHIWLLDFIMYLISLLTYVFCILAIIYNYKKNKDVGIVAFVSFTIGAVVTYIIKHLFYIPRPCESLSDVYLLSSCDNGSTFPSGHTLISSSTFFYLFIEEKSKIRYVYLILPFIIGFSRIYLGVHYPFDVFAGLLFGFLIAYILSKNKDMFRNLFNILKSKL